MFPYFLTFLFLASSLFAAPELPKNPIELAAQDALDMKNPNVAFIWIDEKDEPELVKAYEKASEDQMNDEKKKEFFDTLIRLHKKSTPFSYGLKSDQEASFVDTAVARSLEKRTTEDLSVISSLILMNLRNDLQKVLALKDAANRDLNQGRKFLKAYFQLLNKVDTLLKDSLSDQDP